jgi:caffeoyl-CoA O-methyltransferase
VITCDINAEWTEIAKSYWQKAKVAHKIDLRLAPAEESLEQLLANGESESFDFIFIDANKTQYDFYYEKSLLLLAPGKLLAIDNTLQKGRVADLNCNDKITKTIRMLNEKICHDERVAMCMLPIGDGLTLVRKR